MRVELKISPENAIIIASTLQAVYHSKAFTRRDKSTMSICLDVAAKLDAKAVSLKAKMNLFNSRKKITVSLKFHEADMLELILIQQLKGIETPYIRQEIQSTINQLNQKLA